MALQFTQYFREQVLPKRPSDLTEELIESVIRAPELRRVQSDGRVRLWARVPSLDGRALRVVMLEDGQTVHNAFLDRSPPPEISEDAP